MDKIEQRRWNWRAIAAAAACRSGALRVANMASRHYQLRNGRIHRSSPKLVILCYHRVGTGGVPLYSELPATLFEAQMRHLKSNYRLVRVAEIPALLASGDFDGPAVAITFDDGYTGTYTDAFPILRTYGIPATTYLTVESVETGVPAWYDRIFLALNVCDKPQLTIDFGTQEHVYHLTSADRRFTAALDINRRLRKIPDAQRRHVCNEIERRIPLPHGPLCGRVLNWTQVREMQAQGHSFGCHTMTHPAVSRLEPRQYDFELLQSRKLIEERTGDPATDFAFPFGLQQDCGFVAQLLPSFGYRTATTMIPGVNGTGVDLFQLYRQGFVTEPVSVFACKLAWLFLADQVPSPSVSNEFSGSIGDTVSEVHY